MLHVKYNIILVLHNMSSTKNKIIRITNNKILLQINSRFCEV